jgi:DNA polymerase delta subunit 1
VSFSDQDINKLWSYSSKVAEEISNHFPAPIKLEFEEKIYSFLLLFSKKNYVYLTYNKDGTVSNNLGKKGVLLVRRDNCDFVRDIFRDVILLISKNKNKASIIKYFTKKINEMFDDKVDPSKFVISKSIGNYNDFNIDETKVSNGKLLIGDYKVPLCSTESQLKKKNANDSREFYLFSLPAQIQLAIRMKERGNNVTTGSRVEYLITDIVNNTGKQYEKIENYDYYLNHKDEITIDYFYYLKALKNPISNILKIVFKDTTFFKNEYKKRLEHFNYMQCVQEPKFIICEEEE